MNKHVDKILDFLIYTFFAIIAALLLIAINLSAAFLPLDW